MTITSAQTKAGGGRLVSGTDGENGMSVGRNGEVISGAPLLHRYEWPDQDPRKRSMPTRVSTPADRLTLERCARPRGLERHFEGLASMDCSAADKVLSVLNHRSVQFNSRSRFAAGERNRAMIQAACANHAPVRLVLPMFCVVPNPIKRFDASRVGGAERVTLLTLHALCVAVATVYPPGLVIELVADSSFYAGPFGVSPAEARRYHAELAAEIDRQSLAGNVRLHDMTGVLAPQSQAFGARYKHWQAAYARDPLCDGIAVHSLASWLESMRMCINVVEPGREYAWLRRQFGAGPAGGAGDELRDRSRQALVEYRALKAAAADVYWEDRAFPGAVRATIHSKSVPVLGLRVYPEYRFSSSLLPYHGVAVIGRRVGSGEPSMTVEPELFCWGRSGLTRVISESGGTEFYESFPAF